MPRLGAVLLARVAASKVQDEAEKKMVAAWARSLTAEESFLCRRLLGLAPPHVAAAAALLLARRAAREGIHNEVLAQGLFVA